MKNMFSFLKGLTNLTPLLKITSLFILLICTGAVQAADIVWDFSTYTKEVSLTNNKTYEYTATDGTKKLWYTAGSSEKIVSTGYLKENGRSGSGTITELDGTKVSGMNRTFRLFISGTGKLTITCTDQIGKYDAYDGSAKGTQLLKAYTANTTSATITVTTSPLYITTSSKGYVSKITWSPEGSGYTITYQTNDGTSVDQATGQTKLPDPLPTTTKTGYTLEGWYTDANFTTKVTEGGALTQDTTLYAHWTEDKYTLSYNANTPNPWSLEASQIPHAVASMPTDASDVRVTTVSATTPTCYQNGSTNYAIYTFKNWNTKADGSGTSYAAGADITLTENTTLYAQWTAVPFNIKYYDSDNTELTGLTPATYTYGTDVTFPIPTKIGYTFKAWHQKSATGATVTSTGTNFGDFVLYAEWEAITTTTYTVTYDANGGNCDPTSATYTTGGTAITLPTPTYTGYTFQGWYDAATGGNKIGDAGASYTPTADITLYAKWITTSATTEACNTLTITSSATSYELGNQVLYNGKNDGNNTYYYTSSPIVQLKNKAVAGIRFKGQQEYDVSIDSVYTATSYDGPYTPLTVFAATTYKNKSDGVFGISGVNIPAGSYVKFKFKGGTKNEFRIKGLCVDEINATDPSYTFHYGEKDGSGYQTLNFVQVGSTNEWQITDFIFPDVSTNQASYVGKGEWKDSGLGSGNAKSADLYLYNMPIASLQGSSCTNQVVGWEQNSSNGHKAIGTLRIYDNSSADNLYIGFIPNGYGLMHGADGSTWGDGLAFSKDENNTWTTSEVTLTDEMLADTYKYYVGLFTSDGNYTYCGNSETAVLNAMGTYANSAWGSNVSTYSTGQHGVFRMWDNSCNDNNTKNFVCHFVPYYAVVYNANYPSGVSGAPADTYSDYVSTEATQSLTLAAAPTAPAGYTFKGWYDAATDGNLIGNASASYSFAKPTANITLYAQWEAQTSSNCEPSVWYLKVPDGKTNTDRFTFTSTPSGSNSLNNTMTIDGVAYTCATRSGGWKGGFSFTVASGKKASLYLCIKGGGSSRVVNLSNGIDTVSVSIGETANSDGTYKTFEVSELTSGTWTFTCSETKGGETGKSLYVAMLGLLECPTASTYTVTYNANDGTCATASQTYTGTALTLPTPTRDGYTFAGWFTDATSGTQVSDPYTPTANITLYAHWELIPTEECNYITQKTTLSATMGYDFGNQVLYIKNKDSKYSTSQSDTCSPAKYRYYADTVIVQIKNTGSALSAIRFQGKHTGNRSVSKVEISDALDGTYTALTGYTKIDYTASDCGELGISGVNIPAGKFVKFYFSGEFRISGLCVENSSATPATTYTVTYNNNDGTGTTTKATYSGTELTLPTITRDGYTLNGWYSAAAEGELVGDAGDKFTPESDTTLYAQWELHACTVIAAGTAKSDTTMHNSMIGTVDVISPSKVSTSTVAIKLNSSGYIQLAPKSGTSFQTGDEVKVTLYNAESGSKTIGFKLGDQTYSETIAGKKTVTITATLSSKAIESEVVKIYRGSSDTYFVSVEISQCTTCADDIPMITTTSTTSGACDETIELKLVASDGTTAVSAGTVQWYRNDNPIDGANGYTYTATMVGTYYATLTVNCEVQSSNTAVVESQNTPALEKNVDKRYVHDTIPYNAATVYSLFDITSKGTTSDGKQYDTHVTVRRGNNIVTTSVAVNWLREDSINTATGYIALGANYPLLQKWCKDNNLALGDSIFVWAAPVNGCNEVDTKIFDSIPIILTHRRSLGYIVTGTVNGSIFAVNSDNLSDKLYTGLQDLYDVTPLNAYAAYNYENYAAYDLLLLTDYPNANDDKTKSYVDALADLVDRKPVLSLKAHMAKLDAWKAKGFISNPIVPGNNIAKSDTAAQKTLTVLCFSHEMFTGATWDNETERTITILDSVAREKGTSGSYKGLQGFEAAASNDFMNIATIYDSKTKQTLIACCERQNVVEARFVMLSVNRGSTKCINDKGVKMIDLLLAYLLETDPNKVSDCALTFDNGGTEHRTGSGDGLWGTAANWTDGVIPTQAHNVRIEANCTVSGKVYEVANVRLNKNYTITIEPDAGLASVGKFASYETGHPISATPITDPTRITVKADDSHTGLLIHANEDQLAATVQMYSPAHYDATNLTAAGNPTRYWAYVAIPVESAHVPENFRGAYTYLWNEATCWTRYKDGSTLPAWGGIGLSQETPLIFTFAGNLMLAKPYTFTLTNTAGSNGKGMNMIGNSWTAPLQIAKLDSADFGEGLDPTIYLYNTGRDPQGGPSSTGTDYTKATAGQWMTIPIKVAAQTGYAGPKVIPAMQAFEVNFDVNATQTSASFTLDYEKLVRASSYNSDFNQKLYAPKRVVASEYEDEEEYYDDDEVEEEPTPTIEPIMLRLQMESNSKRADLYLLQGESFHTGYDAGWDGYYQSGDTRAVGIYALSENGNLAVSAQPQLAGTTLGTVTDADDDYLLTFTFTGGEGNYPVLYLNDMQQRQSTLIDNDAYYSFRTAETDMENRFVISDQPLDTQITTDLTEIVSDGENYLISNPAGEQMHIAIYDAAGRLCGYMQTADTMIQLEMPAAQGVYMVHAQGEHTQKIVKIVR